ncbi:MAG: 2-amino-4-hydroxy-6-hydroxymethyldihydropteridine diphosphokinase [Anaerolineae bacterium]|nr:2-amino-4-hydroxy-6-hydroxymethyldihydropteridine diphosphokinase [Anaerolineae bacterium]
MNRIYVALGSNIDSERNMRAAVRQLAARFRLLAVSPVYETAPVGTTDQANYLNAAALIETKCSAQALKSALQEIEHALGRVRTADKYAPRTIDLDIALFNDQVLEVGGRHIPDPDLLRYAHIAVPLGDLAPGKRHPETGATLYEIAAALPRAGLERRLDVALWDAPPDAGAAQRPQEDR